MTNHVFLKPRFVGERFDHHSLPLDILKDLAVLEDLITEVAKRKYLDDNPGKQRVPKGFTKDIAFNLTGIEEGSAIPSIEIQPSESSLFPPYFSYFELARESIADGIDAAYNNDDIVPFLTSSELTYFDKIGRGLKEGEVIEFPTPKRQKPSKLTKESRKRLVMASSKEKFTDNVTLRGYVPELDQSKMTFQIKTIEEDNFTAPVPEQHYETLMKAFNGFKDQTKVLIEGEGLFNKKQRMTGIESISHISILDARDIPSRLAEFKKLKDGWLDGVGKAPDKTKLSWISDFLDVHYPDDLELPYFYPTESGGIRAEWENDNYDISLDIDIETHNCQWHALNLKNGEEEGKTLSLDKDDDWQWIIAFLHKGVLTVE